MKILVVDDFEMMRFQMKKELAELGYSNVLEAADGSEASELLLATDEGERFDIIFCDWNMPKVSGFEVLQLCRVLPNYKNTPFVMVTAEAEQETVVKAVKAGANDYIVKPIAGQALRQRLSGIMARQFKDKVA